MVVYSITAVLELGELYLYYTVFGVSIIGVLVSVLY